MKVPPKRIYPYDFKIKAVRIVQSGQSIAETARRLGVNDQTLSNWITAYKEAKLSPYGRGWKLTAEQIKNRLLRAEWARARMLRTFRGNEMADFPEAKR